MVGDPASEPGPGSGRVLLYAALAFVVIWFGYLMFFGPRRPARLENSGMSERAEFDWSVVDLDDKPVSFSSFKGKTIFLNFWATWCGPCVREMPSIDRLARDSRMQGKSIEFVCISTDDDSEKVRRFLKGKNLGMTFLRLGDGKLPSVFYSDGIPSTFLIAPDGRIAATEVGATDWDKPEVVALLEKLARRP